MFIPGMLPISFWVAAFLFGALSIPDAVRRGFIPDMFMPDILFMLCFFVVRRFVAAALRFLTVVLRLFFAFVFDIFIPGMFCMSWPCATTSLVDEGIRPIIMTALNPITWIHAPTLNHFMSSPFESSRIAENTNAPIEMRTRVD